VGDSRAYLFRDRTMRQLTNDHSLVGEMVRRGKLTAEQAEEHPQRSIITRALGPEPAVEVDHMTTYARDGDVFLLCSDGLTSMVGDDAIEQVLREAPDLRSAGQKLIDAANAAGGRDNITVVLFRVEEVGGGVAEEQATVVGEKAPKAEDVRAAAAAAAAQETTATATVTRPEPAATDRAPKRPLPPGASGATRRRRRRLPFALVAVVAVVAVLGVAAYLASRAVFFVGTDSSGVVTIYQGFPYELPLGIKLYQRYYSSGVVASQVPSRRRRSLLDNELRSRSDATDLVRQLETGQLR
jgi:protein phosphatase